MIRLGGDTLDCRRRLDPRPPHPNPLPGVPGRGGAGGMPLVGNSPGFLLDPPFVRSVRFEGDDVVETDTGGEIGKREAIDLRSVPDGETAGDAALVRLSEGDEPQQVADP